ncbi:MAG: hypothetical protein KDB32_12235, partial [Planctomycetes bacterium]|nr:hypothetical protein [Planctomycetota bacterium]
MKLTTAMCLCVAMLLQACASTKEEPKPESGNPDPSLSSEQIVLKVLKEGLVGGDLDVIQQYVAEDYKQHNPMAADGRQGLLDFI